MFFHRKNINMLIGSLDHSRKLLERIYEKMRSNHDADKEYEELRALLWTRQNELLHESNSFEKIIKKITTEESDFEKYMKKLHALMIQKQEDNNILSSLETFLQQANQLIPVVNDLVMEIRRFSDTSVYDEYTHTRHFTFSLQQVEALIQKIKHAEELVTSFHSHSTNWESCFMSIGKI